MDNLQLQQNNLQPTIWETNPKLKALLLVLIFVFLFSGMGLVVFAQWGGAYRDKLYQETQAALPKHTPSQSVNQPVSSSETGTTTPTDIAGWKTYKNDEYGFELGYPGDWVISEAGSDITGALHVTSFTNRNATNKNSAIKISSFSKTSFESTSMLGFSQKDMKKIKIGSHDGIWYQSLVDKGTYIQATNFVRIENDNYGFEINLLIPDQDYRNGNSTTTENIFQEMLKTIKFTK